uniref:RNA polymerase sigma factor for flagellar operon n=1 Tax=Lygus hesperus TaxID=30085 RepID=A0A0A9YMX2_LYGHE
MSRYDEPEEVQTKEWEEALSIIENIFKDYKKGEISSKAVPKMDPLALDVARWKVVWGKKPAQYRLKPFLIWSVDEMPLIPEECESAPDQVNTVKEPVDTQKIKNDRKLRLMRKKIFKMNRRVDEINVLLIHAAEDARNHCGDEDGTWTGGILTDATRTELVIERNAILDKLRKTKKKLMGLKNAGVEQKKLTLVSPEDLRDAQKADACGDSPCGLTLNFDVDVNSEVFNFKHGRRAAIKKEARGNIWAKMANSPLKENSPRRSESMDSEKYKKKKFCKKHHRKMNDAGGVQGFENEVFLERRAVSENDFTRVVEISGNSIQRCEASEGGEREKALGKSIRIYEPRNDSLERIGICKESRKIGCQKLSQQGCQTEFVAGKLPCAKKSELVSSNAKNEVSTSVFVPSCSSGGLSSSHSKKDKIRGSSFKMGDTPDVKRQSEPGKLPKVRKYPPPASKEARSKVHARSKLENKELATKVRSHKVNESVTNTES